ncbi:hypothetical protein AVEN_110794-1 [Araneus ventricosus]|uniref:Uncharacterized protein n=1 Tax=Araneus ventricosus TaxID=182803 RepID=A0A4Y2Q6J0_ARAVE|nr:hypothetical protein AVEN_110794-1 [Araneus ventricosus]
MNAGSIPGSAAFEVLSHSTTKSYNETFRYLAERFNPCHGNLCDNPLPLPTTRFPKPFRQAFSSIWALSSSKGLEMILILLVVSASANYNYGYLYLRPTYEDYYRGYYGHHYGGYGQKINTNSAVAVLSSIVGRGEVAVSDKIIYDLPNSSPEFIYSPSTSVAVGIAVEDSRQLPTFAAIPISNAALAVSRAAIPANAAVPASRYIPGHRYGTPAIYGYSSGAYTYYSPSVLSPYSYGSYGSYGSYHSDPYSYLYKK